jgi:hypothetical protein
VSAGISAAVGQGLDNLLSQAGLAIMETAFGWVDGPSQGWSDAQILGSMASVPVAAGVGALATASGLTGMAGTAIDNGVSAVVAQGQSIGQAINSTVQATTVSSVFAFGMVSGGEVLTDFAASAGVEGAAELSQLSTMAGEVASEQAAAMRAAQLAGQLTIAGPATTSIFVTGACYSVVCNY